MQVTTINNLPTLLIFYPKTRDYANNFTAYLWDYLELAFGLRRKI